MSQEDITHGARVIASGGVIAHPTEGVFGLACDPASRAALERVMRIKQRDASKGVILLAHCPDALQPYCAELEPNMTARLTKTYPHPTTFIVPAAPGASDLLTGGRSTLAVRITTHDLSLTLCRTLEHPIVSTSANRGGEPPARDAITVRETLGDDLDLIVDGELGDAQGPSAIIDIVTGQIVRPAPVKDTST